MPIYEYQCEKCGETTEVLQKFSDAPMATCPSCGGHVEKLMSMNSFQLKGNGWYVTDYKGKTESSSGKPATAETKAAEAKTESKETSAPKETAAPKAADKA